MKRKYIIALVIIFIIFLACLFVFSEYRKYKLNQTYGEALTLVTEELSINYINGNKIKVNNETEKIEFSVTNHSSDTKYYYVKLTNVLNADEASYTLKSNNQVFESFSSSFSKTLLGNRIEIKPQETHRYTMDISNPLKNTLTFEIETDIEEVDNSFASVILQNNTILESQEENGLIRKAEQDGDVYYFRGKVENNYVMFANQMWRIVKINEDKTVKLVLNSITEAMIPFNVTSALGNNDFVTSNLNAELEKFYNTLLMDNDNYIASTRYCYDNSVNLDENGKIEYLSNSRLFQEANPTNACNGTSLSKKIATLTADEVMFAGATTGENKDYYLYLPNLQSSWWTMTPNKKENGKTSYIAVMSNGSLIKDIQEDTNLFFRPVITLVKKTNVLGDGSKENPYHLNINN